MNKRETNIAAGLPPPQSRTARPWFGLLAMLAPAIGALACCGNLVLSFNPIRGNPFETQIAPSVLFWCGASLGGLMFAVISMRRRERWRGLGVAGVLLNGFLLPALAYWWIMNAPQGPVQQRQRAHDDEFMKFQNAERERDRKHTRLRLAHQNPPDWLRLTQVTWKDDFHQYQRIGAAGPLTGSLFPKGVTARVVWPAPRQFELTIDFDTMETDLKVEVKDVPGATATHNGAEIALPIELPPGKHVVIIKGMCP